MAHSIKKASEIEGIPEGSLMARLHKYDPKKGHVLRRLNVSGNFFQPGFWYVLPKSAAEALGTIHSSPNDFSSPKAFTICTHQEALDLEWQEDENNKRKVEKVQIPKDFTVFKVGAKKPVFEAPLEIHKEVGSSPAVVEVVAEDDVEEEEDEKPAAKKRRGRPSAKK